MLEHRDRTERVIGLAIEVHCQTGPGLLDRPTRGVMGFELEQAGIPLLRQVGIQVYYKGT
jgi:GxxExxY protein